MTRDQARSLGLKLYDTGMPCKHGHLSERYVVSADCKQCIYERSAKRDRAVVKAKKAEYQRKNKAKANQYKYAWAAKNPDKRHATNVKYYRNNKEKEASRTSRWAKENPGRVCATVRKRQLAQMMRTPAWADLDAIVRIYEECARVSKKTGIPHEVDHVIPLQGKHVSGLHVAENLAIITQSMNRSKKNSYLAA